MAETGGISGKGGFGFCALQNPCSFEHSFYFMDLKSRSRQMHAHVEDGKLVTSEHEFCRFVI